MRPSKRKKTHISSNFDDAAKAGPSQNSFSILEHFVEKSVPIFKKSRKNSFAIQDDHSRGKAIDSQKHPSQKKNTVPLAAPYRVAIVFKFKQRQPLIKQSIHTQCNYGVVQLFSTFI
jgi:hypothetical protein